MTQFELSLSPLLPPALIVGLAIAAALVVALAIYARRPGAFLRALGFALIIFALLDPSLVRQDREPLKDVVAVVVDQSGSQTIGERRVQTEGARAEFAAIQAQPDERIEVPVRIEHGGPNVVEIEVEALPDELTAINNKAVLTIEGVRDKLKVLLVSGEPHAGERTWRNLLKSDANVELVHFTILRPPEKQDGTPINELSLIAFPTSDLFGRKINEFDLIIFDRYSNQSILPSVYFENIVRYVREGGAILMAVGPDFSRAQGLYYSPLGKISPARPDGSLTERPFRADVTEDGRKHPVTRGLPGAASEKPQWGEWFR